MAQPFDPDRLRITGRVFPLADQVGIQTGGYALFTVSDNGVLVYRSGAPVNQELVWMDRTGAPTQSAGPPGDYSNFRLSPDEKRIAFDRDAQSTSPDTWTLDLLRSVTSRLTSDPATDNFPIWSPDGLRILFSSRRSGAFDLYIKSATGAGREELFLKLGTPTGWGTDWSRDGRYVMYQIPDPKTGQDLWIAPQSGDRKPFPYLKTQFNEQDGRFSPDGHWVAYVSDETGSDEIHVQAFPLSGGKWPISRAGGSEPAWRKDGLELFYVAADQNLMAVPIKLGTTVDAGEAKVLFPVPVRTLKRSYAVSRDGQRFLIIRPTGEAHPITVVLNWQAGLHK
jgi:eukaryotic-like serine/threonine-protein kinase